MTTPLRGKVTDPGGTAQTLSGGGADSLLAHAPAAQRAGLDHTLHAAFATGNNALALTAGAVALAGAALVLGLSRQSRPKSPTTTDEGTVDARSATAAIE
ncbi:hypothetical protein ACF08M_24585 [Streptomyces sp. NPDC015032]|uniref:hypothetical protein n=1 Tax=Streptomyces sp. NPDC015032 TaxID=3364937 RepID=UPI0036F9BD28